MQALGFGGNWSIVRQVKVDVFDYCKQVSHVSAVNSVATIVKYCYLYPSNKLIMHVKSYSHNDA